jgi:hypothetical protein
VPLSFEKLTIFPVISDQSASGTRFITLDEGLRQGTIKITELGTGRRRAVLRRALADGAEVNKLALTNRSGKTLILIAGEMILGGKQDRIVGHDCMIEASNVPVPLDVFCVEHGRWSGDSSFGASQTRRPERAALGRGVRERSGRGSGFGFGLGAGSASIVAPMALPNIREKAQAKKSQRDVWNAVAEAVAVNGTETSTGTLQSVYRDERVATRVEDYEKALSPGLAKGNIVGVVAVVGGRIVSADVFANHGLFQAYWPKMLKSYALQAVSTIETTAQDVSRSDAEVFLARTRGDRFADGKAGLYRLAENQSAADASFELEYTKDKPKLIHFNRVAKK